MNGPTALTLLRIILAIAFTVFAMLPDAWARTVALVLFAVAAITDKIDGIWARRTNQVTDLGAFLDPLADKMLTGLAFLVLVYQNIIPLWVFAIILVRDFAVDGMRMVAARNKVTIAASVLGKLKTTFQMTAIFIILLNLIFTNDIINILGNIMLYASLVFTVVSGIDYFIKGYNKFIKSKK